MSAVMETLDMGVKAVTAPIDKLEELAIQTGIENIIPENIFSDGTYVRAVLMKASNPLIVGHKHNTRHINVVMTGKALVSQNGDVQLVQAPSVFESQAGVRKSLYILEDMIWLTVHPNPEGEEDNAKLEERFITKTDNFIEFQKERETLLNAVKEEEKCLGVS